LVWRLPDSVEGSSGSPLYLLLGVRLVAPVVETLTLHPEPNDNLAAFFLLQRTFQWGSPVAEQPAESYCRTRREQHRCAPRKITITRDREHGKHYLAIRDDGDGVPRDDNFTQRDR